MPRSVLLALAALALTACASTSAARSRPTAASRHCALNGAPGVDAPADAREPPQASEPAAKAAQAREVKPPTFSAEERQDIVNLQRFVRTAARKHSLDANLINAVIWVESRFTTRARGKRGPRGLMQLMPRTARTLAKELGRRYEPYSADFNIDAGALYLAKMIALFDGDVALGLAAYNAGPARVRGAREASEPISEQTQTYVRRVLAAQLAFSDESF